MFHYSVKYSKHRLRGFIDAVQRRLATQTVTRHIPQNIAERGQEYFLYLIAI